MLRSVPPPFHAPLNAGSGVSAKAVVARTARREAINKRQTITITLEGLVDLPHASPHTSKTLLGRPVVLVNVHGARIGTGGFVLVLEPLIGEAAAGPGL